MAEETKETKKIFPWKKKKKKEKKKDKKKIEESINTLNGLKDEIGQIK